MDIYGFLNDWEEVLGGVFVDMEHDIVGANQAQLRLGLRADGEQITPNLVPSYAKLKRGSMYDNPSRPFLTPNLAYTGDFYNSMGVIVSDGAVQVVSADEKWDEEVSERTPLRDVYGENVLGIPDEYFETEVRPKLVDALIKLLRG